ncbi:MAG: Ribose ABC transport system, permease protein RbsC, partial [uncultured Rubrobacteraceae bacterium]
ERGDRRPRLGGGGCGAPAAGPGFLGRAGGDLRPDCRRGRLRYPIAELSDGRQPRGRAAGGGHSRGARRRADIRGRHRGHRPLARGDADARERYGRLRRGPRGRHPARLPARRPRGDDLRGPERARHLQGWHYGLYRDPRRAERCDRPRPAHLRRAARRGVRSVPAYIGDGLYRAHRLPDAARARRGRCRARTHVPHGIRDAPAGYGRGQRGGAQHGCQRGPGKGDGVRDQRLSRGRGRHHADRPRGLRRARGQHRVSAQLRRLRRARRCQSLRRARLRRRARRRRPASDGPSERSHPAWGLRVLATRSRRQRSHPVGVSDQVPAV